MQQAGREATSYGLYGAEVGFLSMVGIAAIVDTAEMPPKSFVAVALHACVGAALGTTAAHTLSRQAETDRRRTNRFHVHMLVMLVLLS